MPTPLPLTAAVAPCIAWHACCLQVDRESTDEFVGRMQGYLMLYAAVMQVWAPPRLTAAHSLAPGCGCSWLRGCAVPGIRCSASCPMG